MTKAPRRPLHVLHRLVRGAGLALAFVAGVSTSQTLAAEITTGAVFTSPTTAYPHGVLGDEIEYKRLVIQTEIDGNERNEHVFMVFPTHVFEDIKPRVWEVDGKAGPEVVVVQTHRQLGASLAIYSKDGLLAKTPPIGQRNRWLAPIGAADFDGDGHIEIGYIDRPHLAKTLRLWRFKNGKLREVAALEGLTNHKIGWDFIASGVRDCGEGPEMITADAGWRRIMATRFDGKAIAARGIGAYTGPKSITRALSCSQ